MAVTRDSLFAYLGEQLSVDTSDLDDQTPLFSSGLIDSFSLVDLMTFVETEGGFKFNPADVNLDNLDSVSRILAFAQTQQAG